MDEAPIDVLLVEDDEDEVLLLTEAIEDAGATDLNIIHAPKLAGALEVSARGIRVMNDTIGASVYAYRADVTTQIKTNFTPPGLPKVFRASCA